MVLYKTVKMKKRKRGYYQSTRYYNPAIQYALKPVRYQMKKLRQMINVEYKAVYNQYNANSVGTSATIQNLNIIDQGTSSLARIGEQVKLTRLNMNLFAQIHSSATASQMRVMIFHDKQVNQSTPSSSDIFQDNTAGDILVSHLNLDNRRRFRVLLDRLLFMSQERPNARCTFNKKLNLHINFDGSTSSVADQTTNALYLLLVANEATNTPTVTGNIVTRYVDN